MSRSGFLDRTLLAVARAMEQFFFSEHYAGRHGLLQALDIRFKLGSFLLLLCLASFLHTLPALWLLFGVSLLLAVLSRVPIRFFMKRALLIVPLFTALIVLPATMNIVTPGDPLWTVVKLGHARVWGPYGLPAEIAITRQGLLGGAVFVSRVAVSVSLAVLLTLTSRWTDVFAGLRALFVPRIFVMTLSMTERYLFIFLRLIQDMYRARKSRTIRPLPPSFERSWIASRIGVTYRKSTEMSSAIYHAMLSRGFRGEFFALRRFHAAAKDYLWIAGVISLAGLILTLERGILR